MYSQRQADNLAQGQSRHQMKHNESKIQYYDDQMEEDQLYW
jgi:hypothetical protein